MNLLPQNSTKLETVLADAGDLKPEVISAVDSLPGFKFDPPDAFIPFLIWEYGLGEILPFLENPRQAIQEGILWQRLRGTESGLRLALSWIGMQGVATEQEDLGAHFAEFQMDSGKVPKSITDLDALLKLTYLSAPLRSRLSRIYHGHDIRRFVHDEMVYGDGLLSDYSGVRLEGYPVLSFGRTHSSHAVLPEPASNHTLTSGFASEIKYEDRLIHDYFRFGDMPVQDYQVVHSELFTSIAFYAEIDRGIEYLVGWGRIRSSLIEPGIDYGVNRARTSLRTAHIDYSEDMDISSSRGTLHSFYVEMPPSEWPMMFWPGLEWGAGPWYPVGRRSLHAGFINPDIDYKVGRTRTSLYGTHIDSGEEINVSSSRKRLSTFHLEWDDGLEIKTGRRSFHTRFIDPAIDYAVSRSRASFYTAHIDFSGDMNVSSARGRLRGYQVEMPPSEWTMNYWPSKAWNDTQYLTSMKHTRSN